MDFAITYVLPAAQAFIMFALGLGLTIPDFKRVFTDGKIVVVGLFCQLMIVPAVAFAIVLAFDLSPMLSVGVMLLSFCPGGVSSNMISKMSHGDLALSVSLTAVTSLMAFITIPPLLALSMQYFLAEAAPDISIAGLSFRTFLLTTVPVMAGVTIRHLFTSFTLKVERHLDRLAVSIWLVLVLGLFWANRGLIAETFATLGPSLMIMPAILMIVGWYAARLINAGPTRRKTISVETSIQNSPLGITLSGIIMGGTASGFSEMVLPSAAYSMTMYMVALPAVMLFRRINDDASTGLVQQRAST